MEKRLYELRIDPEFHDLIPPLSDEEYRMLEASIVRSGCDTPLVVWKGIIVDGHNRYEICHKHNIPFALEEKDFEDNDAAMYWMLEHQLARRNLNNYQRSELALKFEPFYRKEARKRQSVLSHNSESLLLQNSAEANKGNAMDKLGKMAGVSRDTLAKVKEINEKANEEMKDQLRSGDISVHKAYTAIKNEEHKGETRTCASCGKEKPFSEFPIHSNRINYSPVCKECEAKAKLEEKELKDRESDPSITGIDVKGGQVGHVLVGLPNKLESFEQLICMLQNTLDYYVTSFQGLINQYQPNMMTSENTRRLHSMINDTNKTINKMLNDHLKEDI